MSRKAAKSEDKIDEQEAAELVIDGTVTGSTEGEVVEEPVSDAETGGEVELSLGDVETGDAPVLSQDVPTETDLNPVLVSFIGWAKGAEVEDLDPYVEAGFINKSYSLTDAGVELLEDEKIGWREMYFIRLGVPVTMKDGRTIRESSSLLIGIGGRDEKQASNYWDCYAGKNLPTLRIYQNRLHSFWNARYPLAQNVTERYTAYGE